MNAKALSEVIGKQGLWNAIGSFLVPVLISDARVNYGRTDYEITPVGGQGTGWVDAKSVKVEK